MKTLRWPLALLLLLALSGCRFGGVPEPESWSKAVRSSKLLTRARDADPLPYRVGVLPLRVEYEPRSMFKDDPARNASIPDLAAFRKELVKGLETITLFERIESRGDDKASLDEVRTAAWNANDDLVLECVLRSYHQEYLGHTAYLTWFLCYATYVWPAWFVPVDSYGGGLEMNVRLRSVQSEARPLLEATYVIKAHEVAQEFTPNDRELAGFLDIGALWNVETSLEESNWRAIERGVGPYVKRELLTRLAQDIESQVAYTLRSRDAAAREPLLRRVRKRFGVVVGVSNYEDPVVGSAPHASQDASAVAGLFSSPAGGGLIQGRDLIVLKDEQATKEDILASIAAISSRATPTDEVVLYFSGFGSSVPDESLERVKDAAAKGITATAISPLGGASVPEGKRTILRWRYKNAEQRPQVAFRIQLNGVTGRLLDSTYRSHKHAFRLSLLDPGTYRWRAGAHDGKATGWTDWSEFTVGEAGPGAVVGLPEEEVGDPGLFLPVNVRSTDLAGTSLSLRELGKALDALPTSRVVVLFDASFGGQGPRTYLPDRQGKGPGRTGLIRELRLTAGRSVLLSSSPGQAAHDLSDAESGLFTHVLRAGIEGEADSDDDGNITLFELASYVGEQVQSRAGLEGVEQKPVLIGETDAPVTWPR